jgi:hypothetical protein
MMNPDSAEAREARAADKTRRRRQRRRSDQQQASDRSTPADSALGILDRAGKLMAMLASDQPGERDNAADALERLRQQHGLDWVDFLRYRMMPLRW